MRADLHMHSTASDGSLTPEELIERLKEEGIELFSLTDHDTTANSEIMERLAKKNNIKYIKGVEVSSTYEGEMFHILGYNIDVNNNELQEIINENERLLIEKDDNSIKLLVSQGFPVDFDEYLNYENDPRRGGWKSLNYLIDKGICKNIDEFFNNIFNEKRKLAFPTFADPQKVISAIKKAGGIAVLAHPRYGKSKFQLIDILNRFKNMGVDGIECSHTNHSEDEIKECIKFCNDNDLLITGGSDYHGGLIEKRKLGKPEFFINSKGIELLLNNKY